MKRRIVVGMVSVFWLFALISFIFTPYVSDLKVFMASANQSNYISKNLVIGAYKAWELKSVLSRLTNYIIYKIVTFFVPFSTYSFEICSKIVYSVFLMVILYLSMMLFWGNDKKKCFMYSEVISILFLQFILNVKCRLK